LVLNFFFFYIVNGHQNTRVLSLILIVLLIKILLSFLYTKEEGDDLISKTCRLVVDTSTSTIIIIIIVCWSKMFAIFLCEFDRRYSLLLQTYFCLFWYIKSKNFFSFCWFDDMATYQSPMISEPILMMMMMMVVSSSTMISETLSFWNILSADCIFESKSSFLIWFFWTDQDMILKVFLNKDHYQSRCKE
jgi:hypothetical protein